MKHHYVPQHYLRAWAGDDGRLHEYSRPHKAIVVRKRHPSETGFQTHLYTVADPLEGQSEQKVELEFLQQVDQFGAECIQAMLVENAQLSPPMREKWALFVMSLIQRNPEKIAYINSHASSGYLKDYVPNPEVGLSELASRMLIDISTMTRVVTFLQEMRWSIGTLPDAVPLMTSDRPVIMSDGLKHDYGHIMLALSPTQFWFAYNTTEVRDRLIASSQGNQLAKAMNRWMVQHALRYAYDAHGRLAGFVDKHMPRAGEKFLSPSSALRAEK